MLISSLHTNQIYTKNIIHTIATCPIIEVGIPHNRFSDVDIILTQLDYARDHNKKQVHGHMGVESHKINTDAIIKYIKK